MKDRDKPAADIGGDWPDSSGGPKNADRPSRELSRLICPGSRNYSK